nr:hypothetical protein [Tanacetum cinerariifolium]
PCQDFRDTCCCTNYPDYVTAGPVDYNTWMHRGERRQMTTPRECFYTNFLKCQPMSFQGTEGVVELALMCDRMFPEESAKVERYIGGLPDMIHGSVKASKPQSMQEAIEFATAMIDKKMLTHAERQAEHKRKFNDTSRNTQHRQQPSKMNNVAWAYTAGQGDRKPYGGTKPLCPSVIIITMGPVHRSVPTVRRLVIWPVIVKADLLLTTTTTRTTTTTITRRPEGQL